jgi:hypothetical protein
MGFHIFASGAGGPKKGGGRKHFNYEKSNCLDGDDFEPPKLLSMIPSSPDAKGVAEKIVGTPEEHLGSATVAGMSKIAEMEFAHLVMMGVDLLAMHGGGGKISLYCVQKKWYWADANSFVTVHLGGSSSPGRDFLKAIGPGLVKTELNHFGVLAQIAIAISKYDSALPGNSSPFLNISIDH